MLQQKKVLKNFPKQKNIDTLLNLKNDVAQHHRKASDSITLSLLSYSSIKKSLNMMNSKLIGRLLTDWKEQFKFVTP